MYLLFGVLVILFLIGFTQTNEFKAFLQNRRDAKQAKQLAEETARKRIKDSQETIDKLHYALFRHGQYGVNKLLADNEFSTQSCDDPNVLIWRFKDTQFYISQDIKRSFFQIHYEGLPK